MREGGARRKGIATRLLDCLHDELGGMDVDRVLVETVAGGAAEALYRKSSCREAFGMIMVRRL